MPTAGICIRTGDSTQDQEGAVFERYEDRELGSILTIHELAQHEAGTAAGAEWWATISSTGSSRFRDAPVVFGLWFGVPDAELDRFDRWYEEEHTAMLLECPDWKTVRRFAGSPTSSGVNRLVLHHLGTADALNSEERAKARATPAARWFLEQPWFRDSRKHVLQRLSN